MIENQAEEIAQLRGQYVGLGEDAIQTAAALESASLTARAYGYDEEAVALATAAQEMRRLSGEFRAGEVDAEGFTTQLGEAQTAASDAFAAMDESDRVDFSNVVSEVGRLGTALLSAIGLATNLRTEIANAAADAIPAGPTEMQIFRDADAQSMRAYEAALAAQNEFNQGEAARNAMTNEELRLQREITNVRERAAEAGAIITDRQARATALAAIAAADVRNTPAEAPNSGGGGSADDDYAEMTATIREQIRELEADRLAFIAAAAAGGNFGNALDLARTKAELLYTALQSGRSDTPALRAEIDALAQSYVGAAGAMDVAEDRISDIQAAQDQISSAGESAFTGLIAGALTFKQALGQLLSEMARMASSRLFTQLFSGGLLGGGGILSRLLGFADGGYTGDGGTYEPAGIVHKGEYVMPKRAVNRIGVDGLESLHRSALRGYADGGLVGGAPLVDKPRLGAAANTGSKPNVEINAPITVNGSAGTPEQNTDLAKKMARQMDETIRGTVVHELYRQMRPGNLLNLQRS